MLFLNERAAHDYTEYIKRLMDPITEVLYIQLDLYRNASITRS